VVHLDDEEERPVDLELDGGLEVVVADLLLEPVLLIRLGRNLLTKPYSVKFKFVITFYDFLVP
jgi:hypothetical protein